MGILENAKLATKRQYPAQNGIQTRIRAPHIHVGNDRAQKVDKQYDNRYDNEIGQVGLYRSANQLPSPKIEETEGVG